MVGKPEGWSRLLKLGYELAGSADATDDAAVDFTRGGQNLKAPVLP
jgi:hypothetical protein